MINSCLNLNLGLLEHVGVFCEESLVDNSPLVLGLLEVRVGKQEEHLRQLALSKNNTSNIALYLYMYLLILFIITHSCADHVLFAHLQLFKWVSVVEFELS